jgi:hypothetical protein
VRAVRVSGRRRWVSQDAASQAQDVGGHQVHAAALTERCLVAMAHSDWDRAEILAGQAGTVLRRAGVEDALVRAVQAQMVAYRGYAHLGRARGES